METVVGLTPAMGGTQRLAERAGPARARELVMTGELYDAATLERWNVVNRVLPDDGFDAAARAFARGSPRGRRAPTRRPRRSCARRSRAACGAADARVPELAGDLFATEDLKGAVRSFLEHGPGPRDLRGPLRGLLHRRVPAARAVMIPRMRASRASRRARRSLLAGCAAALALSAVAPAADTPSPVVVKDPKDAVDRAPRTSPAPRSGWPPTAGCASR